MGWRRKQYDKRQAEPSEHVSAKADNRVFCEQALRPKFVYETKKKAILACKYSDDPQRPYHCSSCGGWHTTSKKVREYIERKGGELSEEAAAKPCLDYIEKQEKINEHRAVREEQDKVRDKVLDYQRDYPLPIYCGFFLNKKEIYDLFPPKLAKQVDYPHITTVFRPQFEDVHYRMLGRTVYIHILGYGNNGINEGLLVRIDTDTTVLQELTKDIKVPHITLSTSPDGKPVDTAELDWEMLDRPITITAKYGVYYSTGVYLSEMKLYNKVFGTN